MDRRWTTLGVVLAFPMKCSVGDPDKYGAAILSPKPLVTYRPSFEGVSVRMVAAGRTPSHAKSEIVSPELVLVDPRLAAEARELQSGQQDTAARFEQLDSDELPLRSERVEPCPRGGRGSR